MAIGAVTVFVDGGLDETTRAEGMRYSISMSTAAAG